MRYRCCKNGHAWRYSDDIKCPSCGELWSRIVYQHPKGPGEPPHFQVDVFHGYVEENMGAKPVFIRSKAERDRLCEEKGLTYDSCKYVRPEPVPTAGEQITLDEVMEEIKTNGPAEPDIRTTRLEPTIDN